MSISSLLCGQVFFNTGTQQVLGCPKAKCVVLNSSVEFSESNEKVQAGILKENDFVNGTIVFAASEC